MLPRLQPETPRALLVEDHDEMRAALRDWLNRRLAPLSLREAHDMAEALKLAGEAPLDFALVNVELPGPNGIETTRELRRRYPRCPVIVMSVQDSGALRLAAIQAGADAFVSKRHLTVELPSILSRCLKPRSSSRPGLRQSASA
jgi:DNA-binding NarL/FixJ family response regulator